MFRYLEKAFVVMVFLLSTGALLTPLYDENGPVADAAQGNLATQIVWASIYGVTSLLIIVHRKRFVYVVTRDKLLLLLLAIALVSVLWSAAPEITGRRSVALLGTSLFGAYLVTRFSLGELLRLLGCALGIASVLSLVFALALPSYGIYIDPRGEAWRGIYWHKNSLGRAMSLSAIVFWFLALDSRRYRLIAWVGFGLSIILLLLSESITSLASLLILLALWPLYKALRWHYKLAVPLYVVMVLIYGIWAMYFAANAETILSIFGRDATLTGRTELWSAVLEMIRQRPWLGYGYGAFWLGWSGESAHVWLRMLGLGGGAYYGAADNGFLDLVLHVGLLGASVFALGFVRAFYRAVFWVRVTKTTEELWPLVFLTYILFYSFSESAILTQNNLFWILYVATLLLMGIRANRFSRTTFIRMSSTRRVVPKLVKSRITNVD